MRVKPGTVRRTLFSDSGSVNQVTVVPKKEDGRTDFRGPETTFSVSKEERKNLRSGTEVNIIELGNGHKSIALGERVVGSV